MQCKKCQTEMIKYGFQNSKKGRTQKFQCKDCGSIGSVPSIPIFSLPGEIKSDCDIEKFLNEKIPLANKKFIIISSLINVPKPKPVKVKKLSKEEIILNIYKKIYPNSIFSDEKLREVIIQEKYNKMTIEKFTLLVQQKRKDWIIKNVYNKKECVALMVI